MVDAAGTDIVRPAITTHDPYRATQQMVGHRGQIGDLAAQFRIVTGFQLPQPGPQPINPLLLTDQIRLILLRRSQQRIGEVGAD